MSCPSCIVALAGNETPNSKSLADILGPYTTRIILVAVGGLIGYGVPRSQKLLWTVAGAGGGFLLGSWMTKSEPEAQLPIPQPYIPPADMPVLTPPSTAAPQLPAPALPAPALPSTPSVRLPALPGQLPVTAFPQAKVPSGMRIVDHRDGMRTITPPPSPAPAPCVGSRLICGAR